MKMRRNILIAIGAAALGVSWYLFRPERLWRDSVVAESLEDAAAPGAFDTAAPPTTALLQGDFRGVAHDGRGRATVYRLGDSTRILRFTDFETSNGPDLYVYLVAAADAPDDESVSRGDYVSLGRLKGNRGDQNYAVPAGLDLSRYRAVSIWCRRFSVNFAAAALQEHGASAEIITVRP
jgi:hypothetical protein